MTALLIAACALLGLLVGSFLNVVIARVPAGESIVSPRSRCPGCQTEISPLDNIPVLSWLILRGKCRTCSMSISYRYPIVELLTAVVFALFAWHFGWSAALPAFLYLGAIGVALAMIDLDVRRLPDVIVVPSYVVALVLLGVGAVVEGTPVVLIRTVLGGLSLYAFYFLLVLVKPAGMGWGDVKLAGVLGLYLGFLGWGSVVVGGFLGFALGGLVGGGLMLARRAGRKSKIPFGPFMLAGAFLAVFWGEILAQAYLDQLNL
ncbi:MAG: prepilin peptidase [Actinomycetes bacterium]